MFNNIVNTKVRIIKWRAMVLTYFNLTNWAMCDLAWLCVKISPSPTLLTLHLRVGEEFLVYKSIAKEVRWEYAKPEVDAIR